MLGTKAGTDSASSRACPAPPEMEDFAKVEPLVLGSHPAETLQLLNSRSPVLSFSEN